MARFRNTGTLFLTLLSTLAGSKARFVFLWSLFVIMLSCANLVRNRSSRGGLEGKVLGCYALPRFQLNPARVVRDRDLLTCRLESDAAILQGQTTEMRLDDSFVVVPGRS